MENNNIKNNQNKLKKHIITKIPIVQETSTVKDVLLMLEKVGNIYDSVDYIYVLDKNENLVGMIYIQELFNNPKKTPIKKFLIENIPTISVETELEKVAHIALKHNLKQVPVIESKKLIGIVSSREILSTINKSLKKNIFHFAGIHNSSLEFENSLEIPIFKAIKNRLSWLIIGLIGAILMAVYIGLFEETLTKNIIIASFIPALVYISGAIGSQFQTIFVRDIAFLGKELKLKKYFLKQIFIGLLIALIIGTLLFVSILIIWTNPHIAFIISLATFIALITTSFISLLITLFIKKFKCDPALGSGPIAILISDLASIVIYFIVVVLLI